MDNKQVEELIDDSLKSISEAGGRDLDTMVNSYLGTALWAGMDDEDEPLDNNYDISDIDRSAVSDSRKDCSKFIDIAGDLLEGLDYNTVGHDFLLTRNHHGAGFWDGDYEKDVGDALTDISEKFQEVYFYAGDDGKVYIG